jgi:pimeloyl-ACP methyl ester carboxylesterase
MAFLKRMIERKTAKTSYGKIGYLSSETDNPKFVYVHGAFGGTDPIVNFIKHFGSDKYCFIAPSLPGHGESFEIEDNFTYEDMVKSMEEFFCQIGIKNAIVVGHSLGGRIVLDASVKSDFDAKAVVLLAPLLDSPKVGFLSMARRVAADFFLDSGLKQAESIETYGNKLDLRQMSDLKNVWKIVKSTTQIDETKSRVPTFVGWGVDDTAIPVRRELVDRIKPVGFRTYPGRHYWFLGNMQCIDDVNNNL